MARVAKKQPTKKTTDAEKLAEAEALLQADKTRREQGYAADEDALRRKWGVEIVQKMFIRAVS